MKKLFLSFVFLILFISPVFAKPVGEVYVNKNYNLDSLKTALVLPVVFQVAISEGEAFFTEKVNQKWDDLIFSLSEDLSFLLKKPKDVIERDMLVKGTKPEALSPEMMAQKAASLSDQYVNAYIRAVVTKCEYITVRHPEELEWATTYDYISVRENNKWVTKSVPRRYQRVKPAWSENFAVGAVTIEIRDSKTNDLIIGSSVSATTGDDLFTSAPTLTTHITNVITNATKRLTKIK
ncbi:MAG: hypothetical protein RR272_03165 [Synergistaceae bacterium]